MSQILCELIGFGDILERRSVGLGVEFSWHSPLLL